MMDNFNFDDLRTQYNYEIAYRTAIGQRESQQDSGYIGATNQEVIGIICDGMGGIAGGRIASETAVASFLEFYQYFTTIGITPTEWLQQAADNIDDIVYSLKNENGKRIGAGTTLIAVVIKDNYLNWLSVGDSRLYIHRESEFVQVTNDHNYFMELQEKLSKNQISREEYVIESLSGEALLSYMGMGGLALIDTNQFVFELERGDTLVLCSDGLYRTVFDQEMKKIIEASRTTEEIAQRFEMKIRESANPMQDNYTFIIIRKV